MGQTRRNIPLRIREERGNNTQFYDDVRPYQYRDSINEVVNEEEYNYDIVDKFYDRFSDDYAGLYYDDQDNRQEDW